jgi:hypothetical protein
MSEKKTRKRRKGQIENDRTKPHHTIENTKGTKIEVLDEYWNYDSMRLVPITQGTMERLIQNGILWARTHPDAIKVSQFLDMNGITKSTWDRWEEKYETIREGNKIIVSILGNKRELGLLTRKYEPGSTAYMMPHYDSDWKKIVEWRTGLTQKTEAAGGTQFVVIPEYGRSPLVPDKKED